MAFPADSCGKQLFVWLRFLVLLTQTMGQSIHCSVSPDGSATVGDCTCTDMEHYSARMDQVTASCCDNFFQDGNCADGIPIECDITCAVDFVQFWDDCGPFITGQGDNVPQSVRLAFEGVSAMCHATLDDNQVHDTDPITPGDQFDPNARLTTSVHCHGQTLSTAQQLSDTTGPMDGLWMIVVNGDQSCLYGDNADPEHCEVNINRQALFDAMEAEFGDCNLGPGGKGGHRRVQTTDHEPANMICDFSLDTNEDGEVGDGDDLWGGGLFAAIMSKDAVYFMVTNEVTAPLVSSCECDEVVGR